MSITTLSRRKLLKAGAALGTAAIVGTGAARAQDKRMRQFFWGSKDRADRTYAVNDLYIKKFSDTKIDGEFIGWGDYWTRMATQAGARNLPDIIQMDYRYIFEYARRGALMPLDGFMGKALDIADFGANSIDCGKVDGKLYGVNLGNNTFAMMINTSFFTENKLEMPKVGTTWKQFTEIAAAASKVKEGIFGTIDGSGAEPVLEAFLRQRGKALYTADGKAGFSVEDIADWFAYWDDLRTRKICVSPDIQALYKNNIDTDPLTLGKSATAFAHSNQLVGYQALSKNKIGISAYPFGEAGSKPGQYLKPSMFFSVAANSKLGEDAARYISFFVKDPGAVVAASVERGVPPSSASRATLAPTLDELGKTAVEYISVMTDKVGALPPPPPRGAGENEKILLRVSQEVAFGKVKIAAGAKAFYDEAVAALDRG